ncbi:penicillin-binding transpeptidase domain-containing protein [Pantoea sp. y20]
MAKGASLYNPWHAENKAIERRNLILSIARLRAVITESQLNEALQAKAEVRFRSEVFTDHPGFINTMRQELQQIRERTGLNIQGLRIFTTFDPVAQEATEAAVSETMPGLIKAKQNNLQSVVVVAEKSKGRILSIFSDRYVSYNGFNRAAEARRQVGSLIKPGIYAAALSDPQSFSLRTWIEDEPLTIHQGKKQDWSPRNAARKYLGKILLIDALAKSVNIPTVNLGMSVGLDEVASVLTDLGLPAEAINTNPSLLLGTSDLTPVELTTYLQTIANYGVRTGLYTIESITDKSGSVHYSHDSKPVQVVPEQAAWLTLYAMQESVKSGTSRKIGYKFPHSGLSAKTGTSSQQRDSWFIAIDNNIVLLTWTGNDDNSPTGLYGSTGAMIIAENFFLKYGIRKLSLKNNNTIVMEKVSQDGSVICGVGSRQSLSDPVRYIPVWNTAQNYRCSSIGQFMPLSIKKKYDSEDILNLF